MSLPILEVENIRAAYGPIEVLKGLSLKVQEGEIVTVIGANGAGKTSLLKAISKILPLRGGALHFQGKDLHEISASSLVALGLAHVPEGRKIFPRLTVLENLELGAYTRSDATEIKQSLEHAMTLFPILAERRGQQGGTLSGGEQQMLAIARALMSKPKLLLMDEPSMGVAPKLVTSIFETIQKLNREGLSILLVEQNAHLALEVSSRGYVLETGEFTLTDKSSVLAEDPRVRQSYLGHT